MPRIGVLGSLVWDEIHGRDQLSPPVEEWGGIAYALAAMDAALPDDWELVPLVKTGSDLSDRAAAFVRGMARVPPGFRFVQVAAPNNRVVLRYQDGARRCERMSGGVPSWTWPELGPLIGDLDVLYINFISGFELTLGTTELLRQGFAGPIYADLHSLFLGMQIDGSRFLRPLGDLDRWFGCFDIVQVNEDEMGQLGGDPMVIITRALAQGVSMWVTTLGSRGAAWVAAPGFTRLSNRSVGNRSAGALRTALTPAPAVDAYDPTGCGDVFGATLAARLAAGDLLEAGVAGAIAAASRAAGFRGTKGLATHLRGGLLESPCG